MFRHSVHFILLVSFFETQYPQDEPEHDFPLPDPSFSLTAFSALPTIRPMDTNKLGRLLLHATKVKTDPYQSPHALWNSLGVGKAQY